MFWIVAGLMALGAVALLLPALTGRQAPWQDGGGADLALCRAQLAELERDLAAGLMSVEDAAASRIDIERRLLRAAKAAPAPVQTISSAAARRRMAAVILVLLMPAAAFGLYTQLGQPQLASAGQADAAAGGPRLEALARLLEDRLKAAPQDAQGWKFLGSIHMEQGRYADAASAYRRAIALQPGEAGLHSGLGEALTHAARGQVTPEAVEAFRQARALNSGDTAAHYFLGLADYQQGRFGDALEAWTALEREAPPDAPWRAELRGRIEALAREMGVDPKAMPPDPAGAGGAAPGKN